MYQIKRKQLVKTDMETCWNFFSAPQNLETITPDGFSMRALTEQPAVMYEGLIIYYRMAPVLRIPLGWITEITHVRHHQFFVDEQRKGPYRLWHHEHHFEEVEGGIMMTDMVSYSLPFGIFGKIAHRLFVRRQLEGIFEYRHKKVEELFNR